jgi:hypothetical protein
MSDQERRENIRNFREGNVKFILVCDLFNEGIDIPETNLLIFMRYTGSKTIWLQQLGRGLRKTKNKDYVHVLDFVGSLERLNEVKDLAKAVERQSVDRENLLSDVEECDDKSAYHDGSLEVKYSAEAAKVLVLLEKMKMQLGSRELIINKAKEYKKRTGLIPDISSVANDLEDISLDQISTHFGTYYNFLKVAFDEDFNYSYMTDKIKKYTNNFIENNEIPPSLRAICNYFSVGMLYEFDEKEINTIYPGFSLIKSDVNCAEVVDTKPKSSSLSESCELIEEFKGIIMNRGDVKKLSENDKKRIKIKYRSTLVFLKKLTETYNNEGF